MTNTTRAIAALSIVAGLGVATLPLNAHAAKVIDGPLQTLAPNPVQPTTIPWTVKFRPRPISNS